MPTFFNQIDLQFYLLVLGVAYLGFVEVLLAISLMILVFRNILRG